MPYRKEEFIDGEIYHIILKALDNNLIFKDIDDYYRGIFSIYEFNNSKSVNIWIRRKQRQREKKKLGPSSLTLYKRDLLVEILAFCFMPNHIHLLLKQLKNKGITNFMSKLGTGYAGYFNRKYQRKGHVFQNRFSSVHIKNDNQLRTIFTYIHTNPLSLIEPKWKEIGIKKPEIAIKFLEEEYKWSSYPNFIGRDNFPSVIKKDFLFKIMGEEEGCRNSIKNWIIYKKELNTAINKYNKIFLE